MRITKNKIKMTRPNDITFDFKAASASRKCPSPKWNNIGVKWNLQAFLWWDPTKFCLYHIMVSPRKPWQVRAPTILLFRFTSVHTSSNPPAKRYTGRTQTLQPQGEKKTRGKNRRLLLNFLISLISLRLFPQSLGSKKSHVFQLNIPSDAFSLRLPCLQSRFFASRPSPLNSWQQTLCPARRDPFLPTFALEIATSILCLLKRGTQRLVRKWKVNEREDKCYLCDIQPFSMSWGGNVL